MWKRPTSAIPILSVVLLAATTTSSDALTRIVPDEFPTIQQAISASAFGDTVLVMPGTYAVFQGPTEGAHPVAWIWIQKGYDYEVQLLYRYGEEGGFMPMGENAPELHYQWLDAQFGDPNTKQALTFLTRYVGKRYAESYGIPDVDRFSFRILRRQVEEIPPLDLTKPN